MNMERNKTIFKIMAAMAAALMVAGVLLLVLTGRDITGRLVLPIVLVVCDVGFGVMMYLGIQHPDWNKQYTLKRETGRLKSKRIVYAPDPEGLRYISYGNIVLQFVVMMDLFFILGDADAENGWMWLMTLALIALMMGPYIYIENKLNKQK